MRNSNENKSDEAVKPVRPSKLKHILRALKHCLFSASGIGGRIRSRLARFKRNIGL
jgi:hypothetical protein